MGLGDSAGRRRFAVWQARLPSGSLRQTCDNSRQHRTSPASDGTGNGGRSALPSLPPRRTAFVRQPPRSHAGIHPPYSRPDSHRHGPARRYSHGRPAAVSAQRLTVMELLLTWLGIGGPRGTVGLLAAPPRLPSYGRLDNAPDHPDAAALGQRERVASGGDHARPLLQAGVSWLRVARAAR